MNPAALRDLLIQLGLAGLIEPHWSDQVHDEWICALLRMRHDLSPAALQRTREMMDQALPGANIGTVTVGDAIAVLPDPNDRHVLAGAVASSASLILTFNMRDFPGSALEPHGIAAVHPDHFLALLSGGDSCGVLSGRADGASETTPRNRSNGLSGRFGTDRLTVAGGRVEQARR